MVMASPDKRLRSAIHILSRDVLDKKEKKLYDVSVKTAFTDLLETAHSYGLSPEDIESLVSMMCKKKFSETANIQLSHCLIPRTVVPSVAILRCVSWIGTKQSSDRFGICLFSWVVAVFDYIDNLQDIHCLYNIIMQYLQHDGMRPYVCMLLMNLTSKDDVLAYRVQRVLRLKSTLGNDPHLNSLLAVYKFYCPHLVNVVVSIATNRLPKNLQTTWTDRIDAIQERGTVTALKEVQTFCTSRIYWTTQDIIRGTRNAPAKKRQRFNEIIPSVENDIGALVPFKQTLSENGPTSLQDISSFNELLQNFQRLKLSQQSLTILRYPDLMHVVSCRKDQEYVAQLNCNMNANILSGLLYDGKSADEVQLQLFLEKALEFAEYLQEGIPVLKTFLTTYLNYRWNGSDITSHIFKMVQRLRLCSVEDLGNILLPIQKRYVLSDVNFKVEALHSLTRLLKNFTSVEWKRFQAMKSRDQRRSSQFIYLFDEVTDDISPTRTIGYLIKFVDRMCNIGLVLENGKNVLLHIVLSFYDAVTDASLVHGLHCECVPSSAVIYYCLFSFDTAALSRMCSLIVRCRKVLDKIKMSGESVKIKSHNPIRYLNRYILDLGNSLWRRRPFADGGKLSSVFDVNEDANSGESIASQVRLSGDTFNLRYHPSLINLAMKFGDIMASDTSNTSGAVRSVANQFISFLAENEFHGVQDFVRTFIRSNDSTSVVLGRT